jgi:hypothetical protein
VFRAELLGRAERKALLRRQILIPFGKGAKNLTNEDDCNSNSIVRLQQKPASPPFQGGSNMSKVSLK